MGQYYVIANLDKQELLAPHDFNHGAKLMEFVSSSDGIMMALGLLLASGNGRGGGDCRSSNILIGSWAGDRVVVAGDYGDEGLYIEELLKKSKKDEQSVDQDRILEQYAKSLVKEDLGKDDLAKFALLVKEFEGKWSSYLKFKDSNFTLYSYASKHFKDISGEMYSLVKRQDL